MAANSHFPNYSSHSYQSWKAARDTLSLAIRTYTNACDNLSSDYGSELLQLSGDSRFAGQRLAEFEAELSSLPQEEERLQNARTSLTRFRNKIPKLVKVHLLSPEILSQIFLESHHDWITGRSDIIELFPTLPTVLSSVCHFWRRVALALPALWSCIDTVVDAPNSDEYFECAQLWAARSSRTALSVHVRHSSESDSACEVSGSGISELISFLKPTASQIRHLKISSYLPSDIFHYVTACMINVGALGFLATLDLETEECDGYPLEFLPLVVAQPHECPPSDRIDEFLQSITKLTLSSVVIPWESTVYSNLIELAVSFSGLPDDFTHGPEDLARVLRSSPQLRVVSLIDHEFLDDSRWAGQDPPIYLNDLQSLTLSSTGVDDCSSLLPLFAPGPNPLYFKILLEESPTFQEELRLFLGRSNVTTLWAKSYDKRPWFSTLCRHLSPLESLTLERCDFSDPDIVVFLAEQRTSCLPPLWPSLASLHLIDCRIKVDTLEPLLAIHSVRQVRIKYTNSYCRLGRAEEDLMVKRLQQSIPDTVISDW